MNLDTRSKRASSVNFWKPYALDLVLPDGAISQGDRQQSAWDYSGILAAAAVVVILVTPEARIYEIPFDDRDLLVIYDDRGLVVPFEDRTLEVKA